jgi:hypothetical protein
MSSYTNFIDKQQLFINICNGLNDCTQMIKVGHSCLPTSPSLIFVYCRTCSILHRVFIAFNFDEVIF